MTADEWEEWRAGDDEDIHIGRTCLEAERELRAAEWQALELLAYATAPPPSRPEPAPAGPSGEPMQMVTVPVEVAVRAARLVLGWNLPAPE